MKFIDFFSGIGGFRLGMTMAGHEGVGHCEIDKYANISYAAIHEPKEDEFFATDIRTVRPRELPDADCYCGGFPCQSFSIAGKRGGFDDTRGTLFFEVMRLAQVRKPRLLFLENVEGLLNHDDGRTFETIIRTMDELGYDAEWQVLNSKNYGVPQNRERVFIIGHLRGERGREVFPLFGTNGETLIQVNSGESVDGRHESACRVYSPEGIGPALNTCGGGGLETKIIVQPVGVLTPKRTEYGKQIRKKYEAHEVDESRHNMTAMEPRTEGFPRILTKGEIKCDKNVRFAEHGLNTQNKENPVGESVHISYVGGVLQIHNPKNQLLYASNAENKNLFPLVMPIENFAALLVGISTLANVCKNQNLSTTQSHTLTIKEWMGLDEKSMKEIVEFANVAERNLHMGLSVLLTTQLVQRMKNLDMTLIILSCYVISAIQDFIKQETSYVSYEIDWDWAFDRAKAAGISDSQLYKQAGNSVTVNVIYEIAKRLE